MDQMLGGLPEVMFYVQTCVVDIISCQDWNCIFVQGPSDVHVASRESAGHPLSVPDTWQHFASQNSAAITTTDVF